MNYDDIRNKLFDLIDNEGTPNVLGDIPELADALKNVVEASISACEEDEDIASDENPRYWMYHTLLLVADDIKALAEACEK